MSVWPCTTWLHHLEIDHDVERDGLVSQPAVTRYACDQPAGHEGDHSDGEVTWPREWKP